MTQESVAEASGLDRSYIGGIERGERNPALDAMLRLAAALRVSPASLFEGLGNVSDAAGVDGVTAAVAEDGLVIRFRYDQYDAEYRLPGATLTEFNQVRNVLREGLSSGGRRADVVTGAFLSAVRFWPQANPSDLWTFLINRVYCDRSNHPAANARLNLEQSWKRTGGWALERVLIAHYAGFLAQNGLTLKASSTAEKAQLLGNINDARIIPDKADILITYPRNGVEQLLGVVHVKASIAERRTDDVPMSQALIEAGYVSVFWTMDAKSFPSEQPINQGEFGGVGASEISDKRRDFEEHGHFSACFSYNRNTIPTPDGRRTPARIVGCDFTNPDDRFSQFLLEAWHRHPR